LTWNASAAIRPHQPQPARSSRASVPDIHRRTGSFEGCAALATGAQLENESLEEKNLRTHTYANRQS